MLQLPHLGLGTTLTEKTDLFKELYIETIIRTLKKVGLFKELYIETIIRNPKKDRSFRLQVGCRGVGLRAPSKGWV